MGTTAVFGIGNVLVGDDAVGPTVIHYLQALWDFPEGVIVEDLGTPSLDLAGRLSGIDTVIFVDAVSAKSDPGTLRLYDREEILRHPPGLRLSPHDPSLKETLLTSQFVGDGPEEIVLIGIVPSTTEGFGLSAEIEAAVPKAAEKVIDELNRHGIHPTRNQVTTVPDPWWVRQRKNES